MKERHIALLVALVIALIIALDNTHWQRGQSGTQDEGTDPFEGIAIVENENVGGGAADSTTPSSVSDNDADGDGPWPKVAWLMSFPNSGTSFTMLLIRTVSKRNTARNNGIGAIDSDTGNSVPLHPDVSPGGPFINHPERHIPLPDRYILTKTHCGLRGNDDFVETQIEFKAKCLKTQFTIGGGNVTTSGRYEPELVKKAIHLVRNPFNNMVSWHHFERESAGTAHKKNVVTAQGEANDGEGFQNRCREMDNNSPLLRKGGSSKSSLLDDGLPHRKYFHDIPCINEFYKYVLWHNYVIETTKQMAIPVYILHYENYLNNYNDTLNDLISFLEIDPIGTPATYQGGHSHEDYYTDKQRKAIRRLMKEFASDETWVLLERYF